MNKFSKKIVTLVIFLNFIFTFTVEPTTLLYIFLKVATIAAWFAFTTGELWLLAGIKKTKVKHIRKERHNVNGDKTDFM